MIKFFRQIRLKLLSNNKVGKYFLYAIGEITLVVIGILIAISINNWNEKEKLRNKEIILLKNIKNDLLASKAELDDASERTYLQNLETRKLVDHLVKHKDYNDSLSNILGSFIYFNSPYLTYSTYESMKSSGTYIISNDNLLKTITELYEHDFTFIVNDQDRLSWEEFTNVNLAFYTKNIEANINDIGGKPNDYKILQNNQEFLNILKLSLRHRQWAEERFSKTSMKIDSVVGLIDDEILKNK